LIPNCGYTNPKDTTTISSGNNGNIENDTLEASSDVNINIEEIFPAPGL